MPAGGIGLAASAEPIANEPIDLVVYAARR
jgi:hypothetical protein